MSENDNVLSNVVQEKPWHTCAESGKKFQFPNGASCSECRRMVSSKYYVYVDMAVVCVKCRQKEINKLIQEMKANLK